MPEKKITHIQIHRALKVILGINYTFKWLDAAITPKCTKWYAAVQFRNDPERKWMPRIMMFYPDAQRIVVLNRIGDPDPTWVKAETIIAMAETRAQAPTPPVNTTK